MSVVVAALTTLSPKFTDFIGHDEVVDPSSSHGYPASLSSSSCHSHDPQPERPYEMRRNEHLAVLLPKALWKPDARAIHCDNFFCRAKFSLFERRHHCRKCGGIFCHFCSSRVTPLLDTSNLSFLHPPRDVPLTTFESPTSPILPSRVCDDCWEQIHGVSTPRTPELVHSSPGLVRCHSSRSDASSCNSSTSTPPNDLPAVLRRSRLDSTRVPSEPSFGGLDAYPLRRSSAICKATGGGRWEPKQTQQHPGYRLPGGKAPFEIEMEKEEEEERLRKLNPIVRDGEFQYRFPREPEPPAATNWDYLSTF